MSAATPQACLTAFVDAMIRRDMPAAEAGLVSAVMTAKSLYAQAANDKARGGVRAGRQKRICEALRSSYAITNWVGTLENFSSNENGKAVLEVEIAPDIRVGTWNNSISDMEAKTLLDQDSAVFRQAKDLHQGDRVVFSGKFFARYATSFAVSRALPPPIEATSSILWSRQRATARSITCEGGSASTSSKTTSVQPILARLASARSGKPKPSMRPSMRP